MNDSDIIMFQSQKKRKTVVYTNNDDRNKLNAAYMMGAYLVRLLLFTCLFTCLSRLFTMECQLILLT